VAGREDGRDDVSGYIRSEGDIDKQVGVLQMCHNLLDGLEWNVALGWVNENKIQAPGRQSVKYAANALVVGVVPKNSLCDVGGFQSFDALIEDVHDARAGVNEDALFEFGELWGSDDGQSGAVHLGAVIAANAPTRTTANFNVVQAAPLFAHAAGEDAEVFDEAVNFSVGPFTDAPHWQTVKGGHDFDAKPIGINVIPFGAVATLTLRMGALTQFELVVHMAKERLRRITVPLKAYFQR
jgi:hypothetical protein